MGLTKNKKLTSFQNSTPI